MFNLRLNPKLSSKKKCIDMLRDNTKRSRNHPLPATEQPIHQI